MVIDLFCVVCNTQHRTGTPVADNKQYVADVMTEDTEHVIDLSDRCKESMLPAW